jgi:uncharacterized protein (DUF58 family)
MIPRDVIKKIRRIQITTDRKVTDVFAGQYQSVFKGVGMEFHEVRKYMPGDDIRSIDWNVTARMGDPFIKKFIEERELTIMFLLDVSMSNRFGTKRRLKNELAAEVCSALAFSAIYNNDKVGMITFTDKVEKYIPPRKSPKHGLRVIREALYNDPEGRGTDLNSALEYLNRIITRSAIVFVISDFLCKDDYKKTLSITNRRHDVIAVNVNDPGEIKMPDAGLVRLRDAETGEEMTVDTSDRRARAFFAKKALKKRNINRELFRSVNVDSIDVSTDRPYAGPLLRFFRMRERRLHAG